MILTFTEAQATFGLSISLSREYSLYITNVELMRIMEIMGKTFYDAVDAHPENYPTLLPYIKNASRYWSYDMYLKQGTTKNSVMGGVTIGQENVEHDKVERQNKIKNNLEVAHFFERELWDFLTDNEDDYELWIANSKKTVMPNFSFNIGDRSDVDY